MRNKHNKTRQSRIKKAASFFVCLGILGLIAVSLQLAAPVSTSGQKWKNAGYNPTSGQVIGKNTVFSLLNTVKDPEINLTVQELGLIYDIAVEDNSVKLLMTLTTPSCPWSSKLLTDMRDALFTSQAVAGLEIEITFNPPWSLDRIDKNALARLQNESRQNGKANPGGAFVPSLSDSTRPGGSTNPLSSRK
jgi:Predicted metal-sulfur cluster biosynthetic enzyme